MLSTTGHRVCLQGYVTPVMILLTAAIGCASEEPDRIEVGGQVLLDGSPIQAGNIRFVPVANGRPTDAQIGPDGRFHLVSRLVGQPKRDGLFPGKYYVAVSTAHVVDEETAEWVAPARYAYYRTSGIEVVVDEPTSSLAIELFSDANGVAAQGLSDVGHEDGYHLGGEHNESDREN